MFDTNDQLGRIVGIIDASANGSTTVDFNGGRPFVFSLSSNSWSTLAITISGNTISWTGTGTIYYGYY